MGHVASEEGDDILTRFLLAANEVQVAYLAAEGDWRYLEGLRRAIADWLTDGTHEVPVVVKHLSVGKEDEHPASVIGGQPKSGALSSDVSGFTVERRRSGHEAHNEVRGGVTVGSSAVPADNTTHKPMPVVVGVNVSEQVPALGTAPTQRAGRWRKSAGG